MSVFLRQVDGLRGKDSFSSWALSVPYVREKPSSSSGIREIFISEILKHHCLLLDNKTVPEIIFQGLLEPLLWKRLASSRLDVLVSPSMGVGDPFHGFMHPGAIQQIEGFLNGSPIIF